MADSRGQLRWGAQCDRWNMIECHHERSEESRFLLRYHGRRRGHVSLAPLVITSISGRLGAPLESTDVVRIIRSHSNAGLLRF